MTDIKTNRWYQFREDEKIVLITALRKEIGELNRDGYTEEELKIHSQLLAELENA